MARIEKSSYGIAKASGPMATVYACPCCKFTIKVPRSRPGDRVGRGYGLRTGSIAFGQMISHVREHHPEQSKD